MASEPTRIERRKRRRTLIDRIFSRWVPSRTPEELDWIGDAEWGWKQQDPIRGRTLLYWSLFIFLAGLLWASQAELDEVTRGNGKVIPSRQVQIIQSVDGGVISELLIREGDIVPAGKVLLKIDATRFESSLQENRSLYLSLLAKAARLQALADGKPFLAPPEVEKELPQLVNQERILYSNRRAELEAQLSIAKQQMNQRSHELEQMRVQQEQASVSYDLTAKELAYTRPLVRAGAASEVDVLRLQRDVNRFKGERDQAAAQIPRIKAAIAEASRNIQEVELSFRNQARIELADVTAKLSGLTASSTALSDRVKHTDVTSPVRGTVKRLLVNTLGGVVQPGSVIAEIVPLEDALLLETQIQPKDIAFLRPGQEAMVRFSAYDFMIYGGLDAVVDQISADTVTDEAGKAYYLVRVRTLKASLGKNLPIIPGMTAEVDIKTGKKTVLSYLLKPLYRAKTRAMTER
ncbi:MAG: HlyD family type I secretion periplasmic adaptor subunit [Thiobacillus sp.]|nr:HlyD family type I secretion periplasmic adaptor subunit [Thiobacillus sp.]